MKVSVIIPVYNGEKYIKNCLTRLLSDEYTDMEVIAVNDGSSDGSGAILDEIAGIDKRVKVIHKENGGVSTARNIGLEQASGDAVMFLDCDDEMEENCILRTVSEMTESGADIVRFRLCYSYPDGNVHEGAAEYPERTALGRADFFENVYKPMMRGVRYNHIVRTLYSKRCINGIRFRTDMRTAEDLCFNIEAFTRAEKYVYLPDVRYFYYCSGTGLTGVGLKFAEKVRCNIKVARAIKDALGAWGCDTPLNRFRADTRILYVTAAKSARIFGKKEAF